MTRTPKFKCVIFDLDGTLLYTLASINKALNEALEICGYPTHTVEETVNFVNYGSVELVRRALPADKRYDEEIMRVHEIYTPILRENVSYGTKPYDGIPEVLRKLKDAGVKLCVMSNKPEHAAKSSIDAYFDKGIFELVRGFVPGVFKKPDSKFTLDVISQAGFKPEDCILVGDSVVDLETAKNALCPVIWVKWGYGTTENIGGIPDYTAEHPKDLEKIIL